MKPGKTKLLIAIEALEAAGFTVDKAQEETYVNASSTCEVKTGALVLRCTPVSNKKKG